MALRAGATLTSRIPAITAAIPASLMAVAKAGAEAVAEQARDRAPVGPTEPHLRDAIHVERATASFTDEGVATRATGYSVYAGDEDIFYGHIIEHGSIHLPPRPFLVPAFEENVDEILAMAAVTLRKIT